MIKPPFTLLLIKKAHEPVTLHITMGFILLVMLFFSVLCLVTGFGIAIFLPRVELPFLNTAESIKLRSDTTYHQVTVETEKVENTAISASSLPGIKNLSVVRHDENDLEILFSFTNVTAHDIVYIWLIVNPDADTGSETVIYPRNPMFRGMPVDYRNGVEYTPSDDKEISVALSDLIDGIKVYNFRILAYSYDGEIIIDKRFNLKKT